MSGGKAGKIRRWRAEDGNEVETPIDVGNDVCSLAVSRDGKWIVTGLGSGQVRVWDAKSHRKVTEFQGHDGGVFALDVSPDGTKIVTGSDDWTVCVWSLSTGRRLLGPLKHDFALATVKFSPDGRLIATATWERNSVRIYNSGTDRLPVTFPICVNSYRSQSLAWAGDSRQLFVLSYDGNIHRLDVSTGRSLSKWAIRDSSDEPTCISLDNNGAFIAASTASSVSFWDTTTHAQIGFVIRHPACIDSMAISENHDLVIGGGTKITLRSLQGTFSDPEAYAGVHNKQAQQQPREWS